MPHDANRDKIKYHTQEDLDRFFAKLYNLSSPRDYALFSLMHYFGLRASEVGLIGLDHLDLKRNRIWVTRLKGGVSAEYPFTPLRQVFKATKDLSQFSWLERPRRIVFIAP